MRQNSSTVGRCFACGIENTSTSAAGPILATAFSIDVCHCLMIQQDLARACSTAEKRFTSEFRACGFFLADLSKHHSCFIFCSWKVRPGKNFLITMWHIIYNFKHGKNRSAFFGGFLEMQQQQKLFKTKVRKACDSAMIKKCFPSNGSSKKWKQQGKKQLLLLFYKEILL